MKKTATVSLLRILLFPIFIFSVSCNRGNATDTSKESEKVKTGTVITSLMPKIRPPISDTIDTVDYDKRMLALSNNDISGRWPVKKPYPLPGAILPYKRIVAFYGNLYSTKMGILGEIPKEQMLKKLKGEMAKWNKADAAIPTIPALHYITVSAQGSPGKNNMYRMRMPFDQIDSILSWAKPIGALVFLDLQVGHSTVKTEIAELEKYLKLPNVHIGIDPEFSMKNGEPPGTKIGTFTSSDINDAIAFLRKIVRENKLPPKVLVVHRFTQKMVTDYQKIKPAPEVQVVMNMDGFGNKALKKSTYMAYIYREPVQFTGFKLFYKNDTRNNPNGLYTPEELLKFKPQPIYIQYQ